MKKADRIKKWNIEMSKSYDLATEYFEKMQALSKEVGGKSYSSSTMMLKQIFALGSEQQIDKFVELYNSYQKMSGQESALMSYLEYTK